MSPALSQAILQMGEALRAEYGVDYSFRILGKGQVIAEHSAAQVKMPTDGPVRRPDGNMEVILPFEGCCAVCSENISAGSKAVHVHGTGMVHLACVPAKKEG